jgi:tetrahydromethanopterin S-methyltransferase subunit G
MDSKTNKIEIQIAILGEQMRSMEVRIDSIETKIDTFLSSIDHTYVRVKEFETLQKEHDKLEGRVHYLLISTLFLALGFIANLAQNFFSK